MEIAAYDCNWLSGSLEFKKLLLMFLIRCQKPIIVEARPFYLLNFMLLARVS